jgi:hypothetical protein
MADWDETVTPESYAEFADPNWEPEIYIPEGASAGKITAAPFKWIEPSLIPPRSWLYGRHLIRGRVSLDVAAGGVGKTSLKIGEAVAMAAGVDLYNKALPEGPLRVWLYNLEDDMDELHRRIAATCEYFRISPAMIADRLFINSGLDQAFTIASATREGVVIHAPVVDDMLQEIAANRIDVAIIDPFVSSHSVSENDNMAIDAVVKRGFVRIAHEGNCAVNLVHHITKQNGMEASVEAARGASALVGAARSAVVYNRMSEDEAAKAGIDPDKRSFYFKVQNGKSNLAPGGERADWYRMNNHDLANGDKVGVAAQWVWPAPADAINPQQKLRCLQAIRAGRWMASSRSKEAWVGVAILDALGLEHDDAEALVLVKSLVKAWLKDGTLQEVEGQDHQRRMRTYVEAN